ncbi:MAG: MFS transporter [Propionibacteriales bacterium]|nr:MFS transporter [Propionibacteriales bacterium]
MQAVRDLRWLLRGRGFRKLFLVRVGSQLSDGVFHVALASYVLFSPERQTTPEAIAASFTAVLLPFSLLGPFTGVLIDRWSRRQILLWSNLLRAVVMLAIAGLVALDSAGFALFVTALLALSVNRFLLAALSASLPHVVDHDRLVMANSITPTCGTAAYLVGLLAGGAVRETIVLLGGPADVVVLLTASVAYVGAGALAMRMRRGQLGPDFDPARPSVREHVRHIMVGLSDGLRHLRERREAAYGLAVIGSHRFFYALSTVATILLYRSYFNDPSDTDAGFAGLTIAVLVSGAGFVTAALVTPIATERISLQSWVFVLLMVAALVEVVPGALYTEPTLLVAAFVLGLSAQGVKISVDTMVQAAVDDAFRGRAFAIYDVIFNVAFVAAAALGALILPPNGKSYGVLALIAFGYAATAAAYARAHHRPGARGLVSAASTTHT